MTRTVGVRGAALCMLTLACLSGPLCAQQITFTASTSNAQVALDERFQVSFTIAGGNLRQPGDFRAPNLNADFLTLMGPSTSQQMSIINGRVSGSFSWTYILQARNVGTYTIPPATITLNGQTLKTNALTIKVTKAVNKPRQQQGGQGGQSPGGQVNLGDNLFIRAIPDKREVWLGEPLTVTYKLFSRIPLQLNSSLKLPRMVGFWSEEIPIQDIDQKLEVFNGKQYETAVLRKIVYFPTQAGRLTISPFEIDVTVQVRERRKTGDPFYDEFFSNPFFDSYRPVTKTLMTEKLDITSKAFPMEGRPEHFKDMVGSYTMSTELDRTSLKAGESATLKVTITGTGNIRFLEEPWLSLPNDMDHYPPVVTENLNKEQGNTSGSKTFEYVLIPRFSGTRVIKPVEFSFFDPGKKRYVSLTSPEYTLQIADGPMADRQNGDAGGASTQPRDLQPLRRTPREDSRGSDIPSTATLLLVLLLPALAATVGIIAKRRHDRTHADVVGLKMRRATRLADKRLARARKHLDAREIDAYYLEVARAVNGWLQDRMAISTFELSHDAVRELLTSRSVSPARIDDVLSVVTAVEYARYSPTRSESSEMQNLYAIARTAIIGVEQELR